MYCLNIAEDRIRTCAACIGGNHFINEVDGLQDILHRRDGLFSRPNALLPAKNMIKSLKAKYISACNIHVPQFQVFLNDLPSTDFSTLFRSLSPSVFIDQIDIAGDVAAKSYSQQAYQVHFTDSYFQTRAFISFILRLLSTGFLKYVFITSKTRI